MSNIRSKLDSILAGNAAPGMAQQAPTPPRRAYSPPVQPQPAPYRPRNLLDGHDYRESAPVHSYANQGMERTSPATSNNDLAILQKSLDQLAQRINSLPKQQAQAVDQTAIAMKSSQSALLDEIRNGYRQISNELAAVQNKSSQHMNADLKRIADGIAMMQNSHNSNPAYISQMQDELANLHAGLNQLIEAPSVSLDGIENELSRFHDLLDELSRRQPTHVDLSGVSRSIETGYSQIVTKLDEVLSSRGTELSTYDMPDYTNQFKTLNTRIEEITRAIVSLSVSPNNTQDIDLLERIEARLAGLSKTVAEIGESSPVSAVNNSMVEDISAQLSHLSEKLDNVHAFANIDTSGNNSSEDIATRLSQILDRLDSFGGFAQSTEPNADFNSTIAAQLAKLSEKLDNANSMEEIGGHIFSDVQGIATRLDALQNELGVLATSLDRAGIEEGRFASSGQHENFSEIESRLAELANRFETLIEHSANPTAFQSNSSSEEVLSVLRELVERVEGIERSAGPSLDATSVAPQLNALENQLTAITAQLGTIGTGSEMPTDLSSVNERLDHIEGQIAASRDIIIDLASEAAQKVAVNSGGSLDEDAYSVIKEELRLLREGQNEVRQSAGTENQLDQISQSINSIAERLARFEEPEQSYYEPVNETMASQQSHSAGSARTVSDAAAKPRDIYRTPSEYAQESKLDLSFASDTGSNYQSSAPMVEPELAGANMHQVDRAPSLDMGFGNSDYENSAYDREPADLSFSSETEPEAKLTEGDEVPLAPGSGMPDLEDLVRKATQRKKGKAAETHEVSEEDASTSELMAAARRAAKMASLEASNMKENAAVKPSKRAKIPSVKLPGFLSRKTLVMSVAAIALLAGSAVVASRFMSGSEDISMVSQVNEQAAATEEKIAADLPAVAEPVEDTASQVRTIEEDTSTADGSSLLAPGRVAEQAPSGFESAPVAQTGESAPASEPEVVTAPLDGGISAPKDLGNAAFLAAINSGDGDALFEAGRRYTDGDGVERSLEEAVKWYRLGADRGHVPSQYRLGNFYEKGHGLAADQVVASEWYSRAAAKGNALAMHNLAVLNAMGVINGEPDMTTAIGWFEKAANMGVKDSQVNLGILYTKGMGVEEDLEQAYKWFAIAAKGGDTDAVKKRDTVAQAMRPEQLEKARGAAELWKPDTLDSAANIALVRDEWKSGSGAAKATLSKGEIVRQTQMMLSKAGFDVGSPDGKFGLKTKNAILSFQKKMGLPEDGEISQKLLEELAKTSI